MASQALPGQRPPWSMPTILEQSSSPKDVVEMAIARLFQLVSSSEQFRSPVLSMNPETSPITHTSSADFLPSRFDPIYIPSRHDVLRQALFLKSKEEQDYTYVVFTSDINSCTFRGFLRTLVADRPFFDPRGPPEWVAEYSAVYEICTRLYAQTLTEDGQSMLYLKNLCDKGEVAQLRMLTENVIGKPSVYKYRTVRIFEEATRCSETGFSPLPPSRPFCEGPPRVPHRPNCSCPLAIQYLWSVRGAESRTSMKSTA